MTPAEEALKRAEDQADTATVQNKNISTGSSAADAALARAEAGGGPATPAQPEAPFDVGRTIIQVGRGAEEGVAGLLGLPGLVGNKLNQWTGREWATPYHPAAPEDFLGAAAKAGWYDPANVPRNTAEKWAEFGGATLPTIATGAATGMPLVPNLLYSTVPGIAAKEAEERLGAPSWATIPIAVATALAGSKVGAGINFMKGVSAAKTAATQGGQALEGAQAANAQAAAEAAQKMQESQAFSLERTNVKAEQETERWRIQNDAAAQKAADLNTAAAHHAVEHTGATADLETVANKLGASKDVDDAAPIMQAKAREWLSGPGDQNFPAKIKRAEDGMFYKTDAQGNLTNVPLVDPKTMGSLSGLRDSIVNSFGKGGLAEPIVAELKPRLPQRILDQLDKVASEQGLSQGQAASLSFEDIRALKTAIGKAMDNPEIVRSAGAQNIAEMYRGISNDARDVVKFSAGPDGLKAFDDFNQEAQRLYGIRAELGDKVVTVANPAGAARETIKNADVYKNLMQDTNLSGQTLGKLSSEPTLKQGLNEIAAAKLRMEKLDPETDFKGMAEGARKNLYGEQNSNDIQGVINRRMQADKGLDDAKTMAAQREQATLQARAHEEAMQNRALEMEGKVKTQASSRAAGQQREAADTMAAAEKNKRALDAIVAANREKMMAWTKIKNWVPGVAGGLGLEEVLGGSPLITMARNALAGQSTGDISNLVYPALAAAGGAALRGTAKQIWQHPDTLRNMLMGTMPLESTQEGHDIYVHKRPQK